ncbi:hypothetical protein SLEP1_g51628 [Rubroshorea leprosula]|uniref:Uncharacterized protein n=1 Tax=Rubroshorea leprosula TaxID=152421 RepID=A0AAV5M5B2_9ROSI|nr:hypothetical protein SLEP1_g51628 [Rubroshorea leprosula]
MRLRWSYDRLRSPEIQQCFLYCSLFREDYEFSRKELIEDWIDEGLINESGSRQKAYDKGHCILNRLERNYLLEKIVKSEVRFKMHDVVRDMAIKSIGPEVRYMVKAGMKLTKVPNEHDWAIDLNKVSLMANYISEIPVGFNPKCPSLSTLILAGNRNLSKIPSSFFEGMVGLKVLDLSGTGVEALPDSISNLVNLSALRLRECQRLKYLPSLAKLRALKKLDLFGAGIEVVPQGMEMLVSLEYLDLNCQNLKEIPTGILPSLSSLQYLVVYPSSGITKRKHIEEVARLSKLESLECGKKGIQDFNYLVNKAKDFESLTAYDLRLTTGERNIRDWEYADEHRKVLIAGCEIGEECIVLPDKLEVLKIHTCKTMKNMRSSLNKTVLLENATELRRCSIAYSGGIECLVELDSSSLCCPVLDKLVELKLSNLPDLIVLVRVEGVATPPHIFRNLRELDFSECLGMRKLLPLELLHALQNLEVIRVDNCRQMEEIIVSSDSDDTSSDKFIFPKLKELRLSFLPELKSICSAKGVMVCDSIEVISLVYCSELKRIPLQLPLLENGEPSPPPGLKELVMDAKSKKWWESVVELDQPNAKNILQPFVEFRRWGIWPTKPRANKTPSFSTPQREQSQKCV